MDRRSHALNFSLLFALHTPIASLSCWSSSWWWDSREIAPEVKARTVRKTAAFATAWSCSPSQGRSISTLLLLPPQVCDCLGRSLPFSVTSVAIVWTRRWRRRLAPPWDAGDCHAGSYGPRWAVASEYHLIHCHVVKKNY